MSVFYKNIISTYVYSRSLTSATLLAGLIFFNVKKYSDIANVF